jgi:hypothetical protein
MKNWILKTFFRKLWCDIENSLQAWKVAYAGREQAEKELSTLNSQLSTLRAKRAVSWPKPAKRIPPEQVRAAFAEPLDVGLQAALHQEIDDYLQDLLDQVSQPPSSALTEQHRLHLAGGIEHVRILQKILLDLHAEAGRQDAELASPD